MYFITKDDCGKLRGSQKEGVHVVYEVMKPCCYTLAKI